MSKNKSFYERELETAAEKAASVKAHARQMGLWEAPPSLDQEVAAEAEAKNPKGGRPAGSKNKTGAQLGAYLRGLGYRDPAARLAMIAGLNSNLDPVELATEQARLVAESLGAEKPGAAVVLGMLKEQRAALEGLMPYWHAKLTPDVNNNTQVNMALMVGGGAPADQGAERPRQSLPPGEMAFAFTPANIKQNQGLIEGRAEISNEHSLTEGSSD